MHSITILAASALLATTNNIEKTTTLPIPNDHSSQIQCLAENAYFEARGQSVAGQIAVMNVVMNRTKDSRFPRTPCKVIRQKSRGICQFSWVCSGSRHISDHKLFAKMVDMAKQVYHKQISDHSRGALFFHARSVRPNWARTSRITTVIGSHIFYRD